MKTRGFVNIANPLFVIIHLWGEAVFCCSPSLRTRGSIRVALVGRFFGRCILQEKDRKSIGG